MKPAGILEIKREEYLKDKINVHARSSKNKNIRDLYRGINEFKQGYQPRSDSLCGLVVRVSGHTSRGPRFDSRCFQIF
jgi:hypothetical protein